MKTIIHYILLTFVLSLPAITVRADANDANNRTRLAEKSVRNNPVSTGGEENRTIDTFHSMQIVDKTLEYKASAGFLPILDESGKPRAKMFYIAYTIENESNDANRPITFLFNGGPGSSSIWLHMGTAGPKRVLMPENGSVLPKTYELVNNQYTWLDTTDLVFIDPVGTGFSQPAQGVSEEKFYDVSEDVKSISEFIQTYISKNNRWLSPKFIAGESYGTTRAVGVAGYLQDEFALNLEGLILISSVLNFQTIAFDAGNDLPYPLYLPAYTASAWFHKKLPKYKSKDLSQVLQESENWAISEYMLSLAKGDILPDSEFRKTAEKLASYTGLPLPYVENGRLRLGPFHFMKKLLHDEHRTIGRMDSRVTGIDVSPLNEYAYNDQSFFNVQGPYVATFNNYLQSELKYDSNMPYKFMSDKVSASWKWQVPGQGYTNVTETLTKTMSENNHLRVLAAMGYYDLATPYFSQKYTYEHLGLDKSLRKNIVYCFYEAGHQVYVDLPSLKKLKGDITSFYKYSQD